VFPCRANTSFDILAPSVALNTGTYPGNYNYCYIPEFGRYYYCTFRFDASTGLWWADCQVDAMASWKPQIGATTAYVLRAAEQFDGTIIDNYYPATSTVTRSIQYTGAAPSEAWEWAAGTYYYAVGIVSGTSNGNIYVNMTRSSLGALLAYLLSPFGYATDADVVMGLTSVIDSKIIAELNPLQYITSIVAIPGWIPEGALTTFPIGMVPDAIPTINRLMAAAGVTGFTFYAHYANYQTEEKTFTFTRQDHPMAGTGDRAYLNVSGTRYSMVIPPFGMIELDSSAAGRARTLEAKIRYDLSTGDAVMDMMADGKIMSRHCGNISIPVQISTVVPAGYSPIAALSTMTQSAMTGNIAGAISGTLGAIGDYAHAMVPHVNTVGGAPSISRMLGPAMLVYEWAVYTQDDVADKGRPLCQVKRLDTLPGFQMISDPHPEIPCTAQELEQIVAALTGGYYFE
jgi:hypothetical protein